MLGSQSIQKPIHPFQSQSAGKGLDGLWCFSSAAFPPVISVSSHQSQPFPGRQQSERKQAFLEGCRGRGSLLWSSTQLLITKYLWLPAAVCCLSLPGYLRGQPAQPRQTQRELRGFAHTHTGVCTCGLCVCAHTQPGAASCCCPWRCSSGICVN